LDIDLSVWTVCEESFFILDSYVEVKSVLLNLIKFQFSAFRIVLRVQMDCSGNDVIAFMSCTWIPTWNAIEIFPNLTKRVSTFTYESSIKKLFLNGIGPHLYKKSEMFTHGITLWVS